MRFYAVMKHDSAAFNDRIIVPCAGALTNIRVYIGARSDMETEHAFYLGTDRDLATSLLMTDSTITELQNDRNGMLFVPLAGEIQGATTGISFFTMYRKKAIVVKEDEELFIRHEKSSTNQSIIIIEAWFSPFKNARMSLRLDATITTTTNGGRNFLIPTTMFLDHILINGGPATGTSKLRMYLIEDENPAFGQGTLGSLARGQFFTESSDHETAVQWNTKNQIGEYILSSDAARPDKIIPIQKWIKAGSMIYLDTADGDGDNVIRMIVNGKAKGEKLPSRYTEYTMGNYIDITGGTY